MLYTIHDNKVYVVLGKEMGNWFPFKGTREHGETNEQAAIREIREETCGAVNIDSIELECNFSTKRKHYHIGLVKISREQINIFYANKEKLLKEWQSGGCKEDEYKWEYMEKNDIKMFHIENIFRKQFHEISYIPIKHYYKKLIRLQRKINNSHPSPIMQHLNTLRRVIV